jgi:hypothetical protein
MRRARAPRHRGDANQYLVGAQFYPCSADATNGGNGAFGPEYQYSTNSSTSHRSQRERSRLVDLARGRRRRLHVRHGRLSPASYGCLNLFFDETTASFNPPYDAGIAIPGAFAIDAQVHGTFTVLVPEPGEFAAGCAALSLAKQQPRRAS